MVGFRALLRKLEPLLRPKLMIRIYLAALSWVTWYMFMIPCWPLLHRLLQRQHLLALFFECSRSNSRRQTYNAGAFNAMSQHITPFRAGVIRANKVCNFIFALDYLIIVHINYHIDLLKLYYNWNAFES